ncbi:hypothetical protein K502DRAFT_328619 [Neoconidiobolus thromboides FSU 785]|nr:hypothetical protein K502DRAFT_328619 [Neoconidiobolus thromboides FSU 785]
MSNNSLLKQPLNANDLDVLLSKTYQLQQDFLELYHIIELQTNNPLNLNYDELMTKLNLLVGKFVSLNEELHKNKNNPLIMVYPNDGIQTEQDANILGILLRTRDLPQVEKDEKELQEDLLTDIDVYQLEKLVGRWKKKLERQDKISFAAKRKFKQMLSKHEFEKQISNVEEEEDSNKAVNKEIDKKEANSEANSPNSKKSKRMEYKSSIKSLDQILGFYSSGRRFDG